MGLGQEALNRVPLGLFTQPDACQTVLAMRSKENTSLSVNDYELRRACGVVYSLQQYQ